MARHVRYPSRVTFLFHLLGPHTGPKSWSPMKSSGWSHSQRGQWNDRFSGVGLPTIPLLGVQVLPGCWDIEPTAPVAAGGACLSYNSPFIPQGVLRMPPFPLCAMLWEALAQGAPPPAVWLALCQSAPWRVFAPPGFRELSGLFLGLLSADWEGLVTFACIRAGSNTS